MQILAFRSLGPKNYSLTYRHCQTGEVQEIVKVRGFSLKSQVTKDLISAQLMKTYIDALLKKEEKGLHIPQWQIRIDPETRELYTSISGKKFNNCDLTKRVICPQPADGSASRIYVTLPYGFTAEMKKNVFALDTFCIS